MAELGFENGARPKSEQFTRPASENLSWSTLRALAARSLPPSQVDPATADDRTHLALTETSQESTRLRRRTAGPRLRRYVQPLVLENSQVRIQSRYEGDVAAVEDADGFFQALLQKPGEPHDLLADFSLDAVMADDRDLVVPGAAFYVLTGRLQMGGGRTSSVTSVRFKRLGRLRQEDIDFHLERGAKYRALLGLDE